MRRVVHREIGGKRRRVTSASSRRSSAKTGGVGFGRMLAQLGCASNALDRSRTRVGSR